MSTVTQAGVELKPLPRQREPRVVCFEYDQDATSASMAVVAALSAATGVDPTDLEPLHTVVDTGALDALGSTRNATADGDIRVTLSLERRTVTVDSCGVVTVTPDERVDIREEGDDSE